MKATYLNMSDFPAEFVANYPRDTVITRNAAECPCCGDVIESVSTHDFKSCKCGAISVDGGMDYARRVIDTKALGTKEIIDRSEHRPQTDEEWESRLNRKWKYLKP